MPDFVFERQCQGVVAGIDEAGRGPWAGPVYAAAVIFPNASLPAALTRAIRDSKRLSPAQREALAPEITTIGITAIASASVEEIDTLNILAATKLAMRRAVERLTLRPDYALIDGNQLPDLTRSDGTSPHCRAIIGGDDRSLSIAAASILAKIARDRVMDELAADYPAYGWERNKGYGTAEHRAALQSHGVSPQHRRSFRPISELLSITY